MYNTIETLQAIAAAWLEEQSRLFDQFQRSLSAEQKENLRLYNVAVRERRRANEQLDRAKKGRRPGPRSKPAEFPPKK